MELNKIPIQKSFNLQQVVNPFKVHNTYEDEHEHWTYEWHSQAHDTEGANLKKQKNELILKTWSKYSLKTTVPERSGAKQEDMIVLYRTESRKVVENKKEKCFINLIQQFYSFHRIFTTSV